MSILAQLAAADLERRGKQISKALSSRLPGPATPRTIFAVAQPREQFPGGELLRMVVMNEGITDVREELNGIGTELGW